MKPVLIDASSAILLYKADLLTTLAEAYPLFMVPAVLREVSVPGHAGAEWFARAFTNSRFALPPAGEADVEGIALNGLGAGEREMLSVARGRGGRFLILDDRKGARCCRLYGIPYVNALLCPKLLFWAGFMEERASRACFDLLSKAGRYQRWIVEFARRCEPREFASFLPSRGRNDFHLINN